MNRILTLMLLFTLSLYAVAGLFAYPIADDVAFIALAKQTDPLTQQYFFWQGRFGYSVMMGYVLPIAPLLIVRIMPTVLIVGIVLVLYKLLKGRVSNPLMASSGLTLAFVTSLPSVWQSLMWYGSSVNYITCIILGGVLLIWLSK